MNILHDIVDQADAVVILSGAGMGVDSGLPDFRGTKGLWKEYPELMKRGLDFEEMANPKWFREDAKLAWAFYGHRLHKYLEIKPHAGFDMLLELCKQKSDNYFIITSNVDNHFQKAGFDPLKIHEVHGSLAYFQCIYGCKREQRKRFEHWQAQIWDAKKKVLIIEIGAGKVIATIRRISERLYLQEFYGSNFVRINPRDCSVPEGAFAIQSGGMDGVSTLLKGYVS